MLTYLDFFFFNDTATTEIYTLSLHDALPISPAPRSRRLEPAAARREVRADLSECSLLDERHGLGRVPSAGRPAPALSERPHVCLAAGPARPRGADEGGAQHHARADGSADARPHTGTHESPDHLTRRAGARPG